MIALIAHIISGFSHLHAVSYVCPQYPPHSSSGCVALRRVAVAGRSRGRHHSRSLAPVLLCSCAPVLTPSLYQMPSRALSRPSLDAAPTSRHPSSSAPAPAPTPTPVTTTPPTKSFTKMLKTSVQGTLRAAGFAGSTGSSTLRPTESPAPNNEDPDQRTLRPAAAASASASAVSNVSADAAGADADADTANTTDKDKQRDESRTARGLRKLGGGMNFIRTRRTTLTLRTTSQPQTASTPQQPSSPPPCTSTPTIPIMSNDTDTNADADADADASMSSPDLPISTPTTADTRTRPHQQQKQQKQHQQQPPPRQQRQQQQQQRPRRESQPQPISRPRPLIPASTSTTSLVHGPDTPTRPSSSRNKPQTPTRKPAHSPPPIRIPSASASTSHLPQYSSYGYGLSPTHHRNTSSTSLLSSPYRESIRKASSLLVRELTRPPQGVKPRDWEHVEFRLRTLARLERIWGKSGAASSSTALPSSSTIGMGGSEDRERRIFCESVRDGYVLCM